MEMKRPLSDSMTRMPWTAKAPPIVALAKALVLKSPSIRRSIRASTWGRRGFLLLLLSCRHGNQAPFTSHGWGGHIGRFGGIFLPDLLQALWPSRADAPPGEYR